MMKRTSQERRGSPSQLIDARIEELNDWRSATLSQLRGLINPRRLFNSSLEGNAMRAIDFREADKVDEASFKALIREAVALNRSAAARRQPRRD